MGFLQDSLDLVIIGQNKILIFLLINVHAWSSLFSVLKGDTDVFSFSQINRRFEDLRDRLDLKNLGVSNISDSNSLSNLWNFSFSALIILNLSNSSRLNLLSWRLMRLLFLWLSLFSWLLFLGLLSLSNLTSIWSSQKVDSSSSNTESQTSEDKFLILREKVFNLIHGKKK